VPAPCSQALDPNPGSPSCESPRTRCSARPRCSPRSCCGTNLPHCGTNLPSPQPPAPVTSQTSASARLDHCEPISAQPGLEIVDPQAGAAIHRPVQGGSCPMPVSAGTMIHRRGPAFPSPAPAFPNCGRQIPTKILWQCTGNAVHGRHAGQSCGDGSANRCRHRCLKRCRLHCSLVPPGAQRRRQLQLERGTQGDGRRGALMVTAGEESSW